MRLDKLVEMVKQLSKEKFEESIKSTKKKRPHSEVDLDPKLNSIIQDR